jgi:hypothetical protein
MGANDIDVGLRTRGSDKSIDTATATVYDFMPRILGEHYRVDDALRPYLYCYGSLAAPFEPMQTAYRRLAENELLAGNTNASLEAYKRGLYNRLVVLGGITLLPDERLLTPTEIEAMDPAGEFSPVEDELVYTISADKHHMDMEPYLAFLDEIRDNEMMLRKLLRQYRANGRDISSGQFADRDREAGELLVNTYARMLRYSDAAWISKELGDVDAEEEYSRLADRLLWENPRLGPFLANNIRLYLENMD